MADVKVPCLIWADDVVLMPKTETGLKKSLEILEKFCMNWKYNVNTDKTKALIFDKTEKLNKKFIYKINGKDIEVKKQYKYFGFILDCNGNFNTTKEDLPVRAKRALFLVLKISTEDYVNVKTMIKVFKYNVKPILLYGSEIWGYQSKENSKVEKVQIMFCKHILGVHRNTTYAAVLGELNIKPFKIDMDVNSLKFYDYINQNRNKLLR